jgi:CBS-domain-containing membrane protein
VLCFGTANHQFAEPRCLILGHFLGAVIGVSINKVFKLMLNTAQYKCLRWIIASLSTALTILVMQLTGTTHPPAGITAVLPATDDVICNLSWYYLPLVLISSIILASFSRIIWHVRASL